MTVGEFLDQFKEFPRDWQITFGLQQFIGLKQRDAKLIDVQLWPLVTLDHERNEYSTLPDVPDGR